MNNINLPLSCPVENIRLDNVMYMNIINDVSCLVDGKIIVLAEHQSTINENMPGQRMYFHVHSLTSSFEYNSKHRKLKPPPSMAAASMIKNVHPCTFFIYEFDYSQTHYCLDMPASCRKLYAEDYPETTILKLSDAFITKPEPAPLELTVQVLNINTAKAHKVLTACKALEEYSLFVEEVRKQMQLDSENGFTNAVKICIEKGILKDYLQRKSREVINMLIAEYDYDTDIAVQRQESLMIGIEQGAYQTKIETAKILKQLGDSTAKIEKATGLSKEEIEAL